MPLIRRGARTVRSPADGPRAVVTAVTAALLPPMILGGILAIHQLEAARDAVPRGAVRMASAIAAGFARAAEDGRSTEADAREGALRAIGAMAGAGAGIIVAEAAADPAASSKIRLNAMIARDLNAALIRPAGAATPSRVAAAEHLSAWNWDIGAPGDSDSPWPGRLRIVLEFAAAGFWIWLAASVAARRAAQSLTQSMRDLSRAAETLSHGDLSVRLPGLGRRDEVGVLAHALDTIRRRALEREKIVRVGLSERTARDQRRAAMDRVTEEFGLAFSGALNRLLRAVEAPDWPDPGHAFSLASDGSGGIGALARSARTDCPDGGGAPAAQDTIPGLIGTLRDDVDRFLRVLTRGDAFQRRYERIPGFDMEAMLIVPDGGESPVTLLDLSRGGAAMRTSLEIEPGTTVAVSLPGSDEAVYARVVRCGAGIVAVAFRQDDRTADQIDRALDILAGLAASMPAPDD